MNPLSTLMYSEVYRVLLWSPVVRSTVLSGVIPIVLGDNIYYC